jgi:uncharacterized protein (DUF2164 family)
MFSGIAYDLFDCTGELTARDRGARIEEKGFEAMKVELSKQVRGDAIASLQRYFDENMPEPIGDLPAGMLLDYFVEEVGAAIYNKAIADAQARMQQHAMDLHGELFAEEMTYWMKVDAKRKKR